MSKPAEVPSVPQQTTTTEAAAPATNSSGVVLLVGRLRDYASSVFKQVGGLHLEEPGNDEAVWSSGAACTCRASEL
jgi:hypothetical protein